jgi:hypothetical protein
LRARGNGHFRGKSKGLTTEGTVEARAFWGYLPLKFGILPARCLIRQFCGFLFRCLTCCGLMVTAWAQSILYRRKFGSLGDGGGRVQDVRALHPHRGDTDSGPHHLSDSAAAAMRFSTFVALMANIGQAGALANPQLLLIAELLRSETLCPLGKNK